MTKLTNEVVHICELELNGVQFRVHHEVEIVKNVVSFAHVQVVNVRILAPSAKRRTVQSSPRCSDCEKCCFFRTRAS